MGGETVWVQGEGEPKEKWDENSRKTWRKGGEGRSRKGEAEAGKIHPMVA